MLRKLLSLVVLAGFVLVTVGCPAPEAGGSGKAKPKKKSNLTTEAK